MKPRTRVETALQHMIPDRCPLQVSFTPEFAQRLRKSMGLVGEAEHNPHGGGNTYDLELALGADMLLTSVGWANSYYQTEDTYVDEWGIGWRSVNYQTRFGQGRYTEIFDHPLADDEKVISYDAPDPNRPELFKDAADVIQKYKEDYWIVGVTVTTIFECAWALRGLDQLLVDFLVDPDLAEAVLDIPYKYHLTAAKRLVELGVDMVWLGDDVGTQSSMLMSPDVWRRFLKPRMANLVASLKRINPRVKVAYHSDGNIYAIIPDLIEIGVDVLNPIQPACMDPVLLKEQYGDKLCFWGSIDVQRTLPFGTPLDVRQEVITRIETLGKGGGFILAPTHHVQLDTPLANFWEMIDTVRNTACK
jgi:uroporphyrinogen decarboxylase